ncbi:hypothetical protein SB6419_01728 [Klebsiella spallanzanii]|nr:hypothetical protein SB6419_01728 [Klebsiella spallanzanii]
MLITMNKHSEQWPAEARFAAIVETATLSEAEIAEYCRKKGLYPEQLQQWKQDFLQVPSAPINKAAMQAVQKENKQLKKELVRKEKALAEAAAILVLRKKLNALYGEPDEED